MERLGVIFLSLVAGVLMANQSVEMGQGLKTTDIFAEWLEFFQREISIVESAVVKVNNVSELCKRNLLTYLHGLQSREPWAIQMWDSMDALPAGIIQGNVLYWPGSYDDCILLDTAIVRPQYCLTKIALNSTINKITEVLHVGSEVTLGVCLPAACSLTDIQYFLEEVLSPNATASITSCQYSSPRALDASAIIIILILSIFGLFVFLGTFWDIFPRLSARESEENLSTNENTHSFISGLISFSAVSNGKALFATNQGGGIGSLHGLRFLSMVWIILLHTFSTSLAPYVIWDNFYSIYDLKNHFLALIILNGNIAVDTFYCMSGLLVSYVFFKKIVKTKQFNATEYYLHRYLRLTPVYAVIIGIAAGLMPYFGSGPNWPSIEQASENCKTNWWLNLLYVSNIFNQSTMCQPHCWFLATDIQLYIFAPLILYPLYKRRVVGLFIAAAFIIAGIISDAVVTDLADLPATSIIFAADSGPKQISYAQIVYMQAYARIGPYVIGLITGYILSQFNKIPEYKNKNFTRICVSTGWILATVFNLSVLFGLYSYIVNGTVPSKHERWAYSAFSRPAWACGIAWIIVACKWGYGGLINSILSWKIFIPLGKLTYCAYILHYNLLVMFYASRQSTLYYDFWMAMYVFLGTLVAAYVLAIPFSLVFEVPIMKLEKLITARHNKSINNNGARTYDSTTNVIEQSAESKGITNIAFEGN